MQRMQKSKRVSLYIDHRPKLIRVNEMHGLGAYAVVAIDQRSPVAEPSPASEYGRRWYFLPPYRGG